MSTDPLQELYRACVSSSWKNGNLSYKLKPVQLELRSAIRNSHHFKYVVKCSRRLGKSYLLCLMAIEECLKKPRTQVRYAAPTNKALKKIVRPIMRTITEDCPEELKPEFNAGDSVFQFKNESEIHLAGVNNDRAENLRGTSCDLFLVDEAGFIDDLNYLIQDVAIPQFLDPDGKVVKGRRLILSSTPPRTPAHEFTAISRQAEIDGNCSIYTIYDAEYPAETIELFKKEAGGDDSTTWKREYLAQDVVDSNYALTPEWNDRFIAEPLKDDHFELYHKYVSLDIGVRDLTVALFAHYDFAKGILYIHDEFVINGPQMTTEKVAIGIKAKEQTCFTQAGICHSVHKRVSDIDLLLLNDLRALHGLYFSPTDKGKLEEMVNEVRIWLGRGKLRVAPHCEQTLGCLKFGVWNEKRDDFDRIPKFGHFDALAALMYMIRNVDTKTNPIPPNWGKAEENYWLEAPDTAKLDRLRKAFGVRGRVGKSEF